jgi:hypothetical protein
MGGLYTDGCYAAAARNGSIGVEGSGGTGDWNE